MQPASILRHVGLAVAIVVAMALLATAQPTARVAARRAPPPQPLMFQQEIDAPGVRPTGLAWDGTNLLVTDLEEQRLWVVRRNGEVVTSIQLPGLVPGPVAFDPVARRFWVVDHPMAPPRTIESAVAAIGRPSERLVRRIIRTESLDPGPYPFSVESVAEIPVTPRANLLPVTGLTWDGETLWLCTGGGLCSCVYRVDTERGEELLSFFPGCVPVGIDVDPSGEWLWLAADNGKGRSAMLLRRSLTARKDRFDRPVSVLQTAEFVLLDRGVRPSDIAAVGNEVWVLDSTHRKLLRYDVE